MGSLGALLARHLVELARAPALRRGLLLLVALTVAGALALRGRPGGGALLGAGLGVLVVGTLGVVVAAGWLVAERRSGRSEWLRTLAPPASCGRLAVALAGWAGATLLALAAGALAAACLPLAHAGGDLARSRPLRFEGGGAERGLWLRPPRGAATAPALRLPLPPDAAGELEVDLRPRFEGGPDLDRVDVAWRRGAEAGVERIGVRGPLRLPIGPSAEPVELTLRSEGAALRVTGARVLSGAVPPAAGLLLGALLLGLCAASVAPLAVACSRATSAPSAAGLAALLLWIAVAREPLLDLAEALGARGGAAALARGVLEAATALAPRLPVVGILGDLGAARVPGGDLAAWMLPVLGYAALGTFAAWVPWPRWLEARR